MVLITGLTMGAMHPQLFTRGWYVVSLILFVTILPVAGFIVPEKGCSTSGNHKKP